jgi:hypothetical protein
LLGGTLLSRPPWVSSVPLDLASVHLTWEKDELAPEVDGSTARAALPSLDLADAGGPGASDQAMVTRYSEAMRLLAPPRLFTDQPCARLVEVCLAGERPEIRYADTTYFRLVDVAEALAHESAALGGAPGDLRRQVADPFALRRRPAPCSVDTLTIRGGRNPRIVLHWRDGLAVAVAGNLLHLMPAGVLQPTGLRRNNSEPANAPGDERVNLWFTQLREYAEEFLGASCPTDSGPVDIAVAEPFASLDRARADGRVRTFCLGLGLDPLTLWGELLTATVFDPDTYDGLLGRAVSENDEGSHAVAIAFTRDRVERLLGSGDLAPAAAACVEMAWRNRDALLG